MTKQENKIKQELKKTLQVTRGKRSAYYMTIEVDGEKLGKGFDDAHFYDALKDIDDKSFYDDAELSAVESILRHHYIEDWMLLTL